MGVVYKLKPEVINYILEEKKAKPILGCRRLVSLVENKFQVRVSKSSVNSLIKELGLSMPIGRRRIRKRRVIAGESTGAILLQAADCLTGGTYQIAEALKKTFPNQEVNLLAVTEFLLYSLLVGEKESKWPLVCQEVTEEAVSSYLLDLQEVKELDFSRLLQDIFQAVRFIQISLPDGAVIHIDGQWHTVWPSQQIPPSFSTTLFDTRNRTTRYLPGNKPIILLEAPGYDLPTKEFFAFIFGLDTLVGPRLNLALYGNKLEKLEEINLEGAKKRCFVFGLWPWQFLDYRQEKMLGEFKEFNFPALGKSFYIAEAEIALLQPTLNKRVTLRSVALKGQLQEETLLFICSNLDPQKVNAEELAGLYLSRWPNLAEGFLDLSRKIELFTAKPDAARIFPTENLKCEKESLQEAKTLFNLYLKYLDLFVRWYFLPLEYQDKDLLVSRERFYGLKTAIKQQRNRTLATFQVSPEYPYLKDLEYACQRANEREIVSRDGKRFWFNVSLG